MPSVDARHRHKGHQFSRNLVLALKEAQERKSGSMSEKVFRSSEEDCQIQIEKSNREELGWGS